MSTIFREKIFMILTLFISFLIIDNNQNFLVYMKIKELRENSAIDFCSLMRFELCTKICIRNVTQAQ